MKRAFTLVELLIVVVVLAILMSFVFKLGKVGDESERRTVTIARMQRLENCISGYHAAFGNYPAVPLHGSRNIYRQVGGHGVQLESGNENKNLWGWTKIGERAEVDAWRQVKAACRSQPVDCRYPFADEYGPYVELVSEELKLGVSSGVWDDVLQNDQRKREQLLAGFDDGVTRNVNRHSSNKEKRDWTEIQLFKFGLMSFLLPRYMVMMNGNPVFFREYAQWTGNNELPSNPFTGERYNNWTQLQDFSTSIEQTDLAKVANIPSQAQCARWMPNLSRICQANHDFRLFGTELRDPAYPTELRGDNLNIEIFSPGDADSASTANQYILDGVTVVDGWNHEFYYYSPAPYQRYVLWSSGPNGRTFPPWVNRKALESRANECVAKWVKDDITRMSN